MADKLSLVPGQIFFIAHSLGGIFALLLADRFADRINGGVTISTPYGGSKFADFLKFLLPNSRFLREIGPHSDPIDQASQIELRWPWINLISVRGGVPWITGDNDGVITTESMKNHTALDTVEINANHYEILLHTETINIIKERTNGFFSN